MTRKDRLREVVTCPVCLEFLKEPKMLPCQHTFCLRCVRRLAKEYKEVSKIRCAQCRAETALPKGGAAALPSNLCLQSLLEVVKSEEENAKQNPLCHVCETACDVKICSHCSRFFCAICEQRHQLDLEGQLREIMGHLVMTKGKMTKRIKAFADLCGQVKESVHLEIQNRVKLILEAESKLVRQIDEVCDRGKMIGAEVIHKLDTNTNRIEEILKDDFEAASSKTAAEKVSLFLDVHRETSSLLRDADTTSLGNLAFSPDTLTLSGPGEEGFRSEEQELVQEGENANSIADGADISVAASGSTDCSSAENAHSLYYRTRPFLSKARLGSAFLQRPAGVAVSPWSREAYVVSMDTHRVYVFDRDRKKCLRSFGSRGQKSGEFMCPYGIALSPVTQEILVTDKWKHCIHVFSRAETFCKQIGSKGSGKAQFRSPESICVDKDGNIFVCDTINNRIQVLDKDGMFLRSIDSQFSGSDASRKRTLFQEPSGIAVTPDGQRLVVCDFSNHRIHVIKTSGEHLLTCGQKGSLRGQFNNPECLAVDSQGFIFVGDSGNCRVQILRPDGRFVRSFGSKGCFPGHFSWISGIAVTESHEVVVCDFKNHCVQIF